MQKKNAKAQTKQNYLWLALEICPLTSSRSQGGSALVAWHKDVRPRERL